MPSPTRKTETPKEAALRLLSFRDHGRGELRRKLLARGFAEAAVDEELARLEEEGLLDDASLAARLVQRELDSGHGPLLIAAKMKMRGIEAGRPAVPLEEEVRSLRRLLDKRGLRSKMLTGPKERAKMLRFLRGRGYTAAAVEAALGPLADEGQN